MARTSVPFGVPVEVAFDYLVDPRNRPAWQASLRAVEVADGHELAPGLGWYDVTRVPGVRPRMELTVLERPHQWVESGSWGRFSAELTLVHTATGPESCVVDADFRVRGLGAGPLLTRLGVVAVRDDLRRAARLLAGS